MSTLAHDAPAHDDPAHDDPATDPARPATARTATPDAERSRRTDSPALPCVRTSLFTTGAVLLASAPGQLPRPWWLQAAVTIVGVAVALGVAALALRIAPSRSARRTRAAVAALCALTTTITVSASIAWQDSLADAIGVARPSALGWCAVILAPASVPAARLLVRNGARGRRPRRVVAGTVAATVAIVGATTLRPDAAPAHPRALVPAMSAGQSLVPWASLGDQGRRVVSAAPAGQIRVYVGLDSATTVAQRVDLAIHELDRLGGFDRGHVVLAAPTGSGWVDEHALDGFARRFGDDVAFVSVQYSSLPSWAAYLVDRRSAIETTTALADALGDRIARDPTPPHVTLFGQSLGATAVARAAHAMRTATPTDIVLSGPPAGTPVPPGAYVTLNGSDPVGRWEPALAWRPPVTPPTRDDAPSPPWLPVASLVAASVDVLTALSAPPGHGHRYGPEQAGPGALTSR